MSKPTFKQAIQVLNLIHNEDKNPEYVEKLLESGILSDIAEADLSQINRNDLREFLFLPKIGFTFRVDYTKPLEKLITTAKFSSADKLITRENVPFQKVCTNAKSWVNAELHTFVRNGTIKGLSPSDGLNGQDYCMSELKKRGVRGATLEELIAFKVAFPDEAKRGKIFAPGSIVNVVSGASWFKGNESGHYNSMACIYNGALDLDSESAWPSYYMLAIRL